MRSINAGEQWWRWNIRALVIMTHRILLIFAVCICILFVSGIFWVDWVVLPVGDNVWIASGRGQVACGAGAQLLPLTRWRLLCGEEVPLSQRWRTMKWGYRYDRVGGGWSCAVPIWPVLCLTTGAAYAIPRIRRWLSNPTNRCERCGYSREGISSTSACPECGHIARLANL